MMRVDGRMGECTYVVGWSGRGDEARGKSTYPRCAYALLPRSLLMRPAFLSSKDSRGETKACVLRKRCSVGLESQSKGSVQQ